MSPATRSPRPPPRAPTRSTPTLLGTIVAARYRVERKIGEGGMSVVYLATDLKDESKIALKALAPSLVEDEKAMARLRREASLGKRLDHPNVCPARDLVELPDRLVAIVMPFLEGELLCDRTARLATLRLAESVPIVRDIAAGLHAAHQLGIVHRDLKPENVMLCPTPGSTERAVVMDFGLAKRHELEARVERITGTGIVLGTPEFMSPEQLRGKPLDARSDVYALALLAFEMLTGQLPFRGRTKNEMMLARLRLDPIPLREVRPDLAASAPLDPVFLKALARERSDRYRTTLEFADAFSAAARGTPQPSRTGWLARLLGR